MSGTFEVARARLHATPFVHGRRRSAAAQEDRALERCNLIPLVWEVPRHHEIIKGEALVQLLHIICSFLTHGLRQLYHAILDVLHVNVFPLQLRLHPVTICHNTARFHQVDLTVRFVQQLLELLVFIDIAAKWNLQDVKTTSTMLSSAGFNTETCHSSGTDSAPTTREVLVGQRPQETWLSLSPF